MSSYVLIGLAHQIADPRVVEHFDGACQRFRPFGHMQFGSRRDYAKANVEIDRQHAAVIRFFGNSMVGLLEIDQATIIK
jgi:phage repressor protein C with HTH and peptisase S24 domain